MEFLLNRGVVVSLVCCASLFAQSNPSSNGQKQEPPASNSAVQAPTQPATGTASGGIDVLSDPMGVNFEPYLNRILPEVKRNWYRHIPESAKAPVMKKGTAVIEFTVLKNGSIADMKLVNSSGEVALDRGAWAGIVGSNPLLPLPTEFVGQYVKLRMKFLYNADRDDVNAQGGNSDMPTRLAVSPVFLQLGSGARQQFLATLAGAANSAVIWNLSCEAAFCGRISADGLYVAPKEVSNPMTVTVMATLAVDPGKTASAVVTLKPSSSR
jgi:TonB family protein